MDRLRGSLAEAMAGRGRIVMLAGEPGIGKTRTAQELVRYAESQVAQIMWGWCYEREGPRRTGPGSNPFCPTCKMPRPANCMPRTWRRRHR